MTRDQLDEYYLTVAEVAELLRLNQQTVRNWIDAGSLPALRVGRRVRIKRSDLAQLLSDGYSAGSQTDGPQAGPSAVDFWGGEPVGVAEPAVNESDGTDGIDAPSVAASAAADLAAANLAASIAQAPDASIAQAGDASIAQASSANGSAAADGGEQAEPTTSSDAAR